MKKSTRNNLISLSCALALVAVGGGVALNAERAKADGIVLAPENLMVVDGAELRLMQEDDATGNGLRFVIKAPDATKLPEGTTATGTLVIPTALLQGELDVTTADAYNFDTLSAWNVYDDGAYSYAYFWNMSEFSYNVELTYRGYITTAEGTFYTATATTSMAEVALEASQNELGDAALAIANSFLLNYDVTFNVGASSSEINDQEVKYGSKVASVADPVLEGYTFNGWLLDGEPFDIANEVVKGDIELTAKWDINTYAVTFKDVDGDTERFAPATVEHNATAEAPEFVALEPYTDSLVWVDENGDLFDFDTPITEATTLTAKRTLSEKIDFTTMTRLPSELLGGNKVVWDLDEENHVLAATTMYKNDNQNGRIYFGDGIQLRQGDKIVVKLEVVGGVDVGHIGVNSVDVWNKAQWSKTTGVEQTLTYNLEQDTFVEYINFKTNHGSSGESLNIKTVEIVRVLDTSAVTDWTNVDFSQIQGVPYGIGGTRLTAYDEEKQAVKISKVQNSEDARFIITFGEPITLGPGKELVIKYSVEAVAGGYSNACLYLNGATEIHDVAFYNQTDMIWRYATDTTTEVTSWALQPYANIYNGTYNIYLKSIKVVDYAEETENYSNINFADFDYAPYFVTKLQYNPNSWSGEFMTTSLGYSETEQALACYNFALNEGNKAAQFLTFDYSHAGITMHTGDVITMRVKMEFASAQQALSTGGDMWINGVNKAYAGLLNSDGSSKGFVDITWTVDESMDGVALSTIKFKSWNISHYYNVYVQSITITTPEA